MKTSLNEFLLSEISQRLHRANTEFMLRYPGESAKRQPVHTVYGGAHLFRSDRALRLGSAAVRAFQRYAPDAATLTRALELPDSLAPMIHTRILEKLQREPVEDFRIDFEDGYGNRLDNEEDADASTVAHEVARGMQASTLPPFIGIRIKPFSEEFRGRAIRTMDIVLSRLVELSANKLPGGFVITLPKVVMPEQVTALADVMDLLEPRLGLPLNALRFELMIETPQSIINNRGESNLPLFVDAARGRCIAMHFGVYDYTASCSITAQHQSMDHPACDFARHMMQVALAGTGIWLSDGATNVMPIGLHRESDDQPLSARQLEENRAVVHRAWKLHYEHVRHSLRHGFYQGWDLHPAQLPTRYAAVSVFFLESLDPAAQRLRNFVEKAARATLVGDIFDDAATGQGLLNLFLRAINCGAITAEEAQQRTSLTLEELRLGSFVKILRGRQGHA